MPQWSDRTSRIFPKKDGELRTPTRVMENLVNNRVHMKNREMYEENENSKSKPIKFDRTFLGYKLQYLFNSG